MIRTYRPDDLVCLMSIWLDANIHAHHFIPREYWTGHYSLVESLLPEAELYVYEDRVSGRIEGFIGLTGHEIAGIFVAGGARSKGVGKQLLDHAKAVKTPLFLHVYRKNLRAIRFYEREQFAVQSEQTDYNTQEPEFLMAWNR